MGGGKRALKLVSCWEFSQGQGDPVKEHPLRTGFKVLSSHFPKTNSPPQTKISTNDGNLQKTPIEIKPSAHHRLPSTQGVWGTKLILREMLFGSLRDITSYSDGGLL